MSKVSKLSPEKAQLRRNQREMTATRERGRVLDYGTKWFNNFCNEDADAAQYSLRSSSQSWCLTLASIC